MKELNFKLYHFADYVTANNLIYGYGDADNKGKDFY